MSADSRFASAHGQVHVDLSAIGHNVGRLRDLVRPGGAGPALMVVVKADGYGHGMLQSARAARAAGAEWLGVATAAEALALRADGDSGRVLCWLAVPGFDFAEVLAADVDVAAYSAAQLEEIRAAAQRVHGARVHLKIDTGLSRGGIPRSDWEAVFRAALETRDIEVTGIWSHFACSDEPDHPANDAQETAFREGLALAERVGLRPRVRHLANSAAALFRPSARFDLVRCGIAAYGLTPAPAVASSDELGLVPAMTVSGTVALTKEIAAGAGVSYGHTFCADRAMRVALVPMGYGDGIPRHASNRAEVWIGGRRGRVLGAVCMDQMVVEAADAQAGDEVVVFGDGQDGVPTAQEWADWCETISYEVVTRMGGRQVRTWSGTGEGSP